MLIFHSYSKTLPEGKSSQSVGIFHGYVDSLVAAGTSKRSYPYCGWLQNPAPVDRWRIPLFVGFQPSKVVQDFFHQEFILVTRPLQKWSQLCCSITYMVYGGVNIRGEGLQLGHPMKQQQFQLISDNKLAVTTVNRPIILRRY